MIYRFIKLIAHVKIIFICWLSIFLLTACAGNHIYAEGYDAQDRGKITRERVTLKSSSMHEACFALAKEQKLQYKFDSDKPVNFNVHFHSENEIHYPVQQNGVTQNYGMIEREDKLLPGNEQQIYCLMWENPEIVAANISYECIEE